MYLCPRARCAFHLSSLQAEHLYTPVGFAPAASFCLSPRISPAAASLSLYFASHSTSSSFLPFPLACLIPGYVAGSATSRAKIHRDFNTFNSFIIRFAPIPRTGNAGDMFHSTSLSFSSSSRGKIELQRSAVASRDDDDGKQLHRRCSRAVISPFISAYRILEHRIFSPALFTQQFGSREFCMRELKSHLSL